MKMKISMQNLESSIEAFYGLYHRMECGQGEASYLALKDLKHEDVKTFKECVNLMNNVDSDYLEKIQKKGAIISHSVLNGNAQSVSERLLRDIKAKEEPEYDTIEKGMVLLTVCKNIADKDPNFLYR